MDVLNTAPIVKRYLGKKYGSGSKGCFIFASKFYEDIFGITVPPDYLEVLKLFNVVKNPKFGDVVLIRAHPIVVNHIGLYLGNNEFLHGGTMENKDEVILSRIYELPWSNLIVGYLRHPRNYDKD
jgi:cell wall-associated NlpC family hydrolase